MEHKEARNDTIVSIQSFGRKTEKFDAWKYWEIVGELIWRGAERFDAYNTAMWCIHANVGEEKDIKPDIHIKIRSKT